MLRPTADGQAGLTPETMTAAEQMFFLGAPLAHVVEYEKMLRIRRLKGPRMSAARLTRIPIRPRQTYNEEPLAEAC
jgi:hypothetical protein